MDSLMESQIFFFISSLGFIILGALVAVICIQVIRVINTFSKIINTIERDIDSIGDTTRELIEDMRDSMVFRFLFKSHRRKK